jgi:hypothetical protein
MVQMFKNWVRNAPYCGAVEAHQHAGSGLSQLYCDRQESSELGSEAREVVRCGSTRALTLLACT